ncbi:hypothetical protein BU24DRAFT_493175 [Aaosphaeria arxii CBS 175.79]|uniref:Uncharacterized protein n=1 Tax=Aaosphaeria arxii CBS 175.79 TaxID=1450172 RepID=A0A6A5XQM9_9PLEO|nr:uncharacterized protein BU24DRAFT_493175 [Aaosphaeria arxii CBS 175.79]KAF2014604.1 hypothetical protein BU24DRAFT_493175 [Aaosphaeria arxii CBS 175.79]
MSLESFALKHFGTDDLDEVRKEFDRYKNILDAPGPPEEDWSRLNLPYFAPDPSLPPLPTVNDIKELERTVYADYIKNPGNRFELAHVWRYNQVYAIKFSLKKNLLQEAENLLFLQDHKVRSTKVYAIWSDDSADLCRWHSIARGRRLYFLVTDWVDGIALDEVKWKGFDRETRTKLCHKIGEQLRLLRSVPPPHPSYYGRIHNQPFRPLTVFSGYTGAVGPFQTYEDFLRQVMDGLEIHALHRHITNPEFRYFPLLDLLRSVFNDSLNSCSKARESKLSHMDLNITNVMLKRPTSDSSISKDVEDWDVQMIDFEWLAWLPAWAETAVVMDRFPQFEDEFEDNGLYDISGGLQPFCFAEASFINICLGHFGAQGAL